MMGKVDTSITFVGGSNRTVVTENYARRMCLKKNRSGYPVIGFGSPEVTMGDLYKVLLRASGKRKITVDGPSIYNGPPAICLNNINWRLLQSREATALDLHQSVGMTYICIGMDYPFLQPRHLKQEQCSGLLHLYTSLLEGGLILLGAELP